MLRSIRTGLFIGILLGVCACATVEGASSERGPYGGIDASPRR